MKVWVVERGAYSDRAILGVFSSKEAAEALVALTTRHRFSYTQEPDAPQDPAYPAPGVQSEPLCDQPDGHASL